MTITTLIQNLAMLLTLVLAHGLIIQTGRPNSPPVQVLAGVFYGAIAIAGMMLPMTLMPGVIFDGRSVVLSLAGLFGGPISAVTAAISASAYRIHLGGDGAIMGVGVTWTSAAIGILGYRLRRAGRLRINTTSLLTLAMLVHVTALIWVHTTPAAIRDAILATIALPFLTLLPATTVLLGHLLLMLETRRQTATTLADTEARLQLAVKAANVGFWVWDRRDDSVYFSPEWKRQLGYAEDELEDRFETWSERLHPAEREQVLQAVSRYADAPVGDYQSEFRLRHRDGGYRWIMTQAAVETDASGRTLRMLGSHIDITEQREREAQIRRLNEELEARVHQRTRELEEANRELETFAYSVSHDLKAPLRAITGYSQLLVSDCAGHLPGEAHHYLHRISHGACQMNHQIEALLQYSRMERRALLSETVDASALTRQLVEERQNDLRDARVQIRLDMPCCRVRADGEGLSLVLRNLLENAIKFSGKSPQPVIEIKAVQQADKYLLCVADNGIGFDMKHHDQIFDIFYRLERDEDYPGTGIGLAMVRKAMQRMGGRVWAESTPGQGARFFLELPA